MAAATINYFHEVVEATEEYLGPAAERFIRRQIDFHLEKDPESINKRDVVRLGDCVKVALGLLINDKSIAEKAVKKFQNIAGK